MLPDKKRVLLWVYIVLACSLLRGIFFIQHINAPLQLDAFQSQQDAGNIAVYAGLGGYSIVIEPGTAFTGLINRLAAEGILEHPYDVRLYGRFTGLASSIKAGDYLLTAGMTPRMLLEKLVKGDVIIYQVVLLEGWTLAQALAAIQSHPMITSTLEAGSPEQLREQLQELLQTDKYPEGLIFPDTYNFSRGTTDRDLLLRAANTMQKVLAEEWQGRDVELPYSEPYEALIMASIIEKETGLASEREQIAGVFVRRLQQRMRLQTDPTVIYGLGENYNGDLTRTDLRTATPYNTYMNNGLTPTPIALPGREAISASLHPDQSDTLYFVARGDGSHYFSSTLEEHQRAVRQYQLGISE